MRRPLIILLSLLIVFAAAAGDAQRTRRSKTTTKRTAVSKSKSRNTSRTPTITPEQKAKQDSIEAQRRWQLRLDSLNTLTAKADEGDISAINQLAMWYYDGHIVDQDYKRAFELWNKGSEMSDVLSTAYLGRCYRLGHGVERDSIEAMNLYAKSIRGGNGALLKYCINKAPEDVFAAMLIADCYDRGDGVKHDVCRAADFYANAADLGSLDGMRNAGLCYMACNDTLKAQPYLRKGADRGDAVCKYWTAKIDFDNNTNVAQAVSMMLDAAQSGVADAQTQMGLLYAKGIGVTHDDTQAVNWYRKAKDQNNALGIWLYADALGNGTGGLRQDLTEALILKAKALGLCSDVMTDVVNPDSQMTFDVYRLGLKSLLVNNDAASALEAAKILSKAKVPEAKLLEALATASTCNAKASPKKAAKILSKLAAVNPQAAHYLQIINSSGTPQAIDVNAAVSSYYGTDAQLLRYLSESLKPASK